VGKEEVGKEEEVKVLEVRTEAEGLRAVRSRCSRFVFGAGAAVVAPSVERIATAGVAAHVCRGRGRRWRRR
jgi:hypothetical protein